MNDPRRKYSPRKPQAKFYLTTEAIALLQRESRRTSLPMSQILDALIKRALVGKAKIDYVPKPLPAVAPRVSAAKPEDYSFVDE